ncbi:MAG: phoD [Ramlibacter sp.]|nr:phoD [Ramlibacter sp.]
MPLRASVLSRAVQGLASGAELRLFGEVRFGTLAQLCLLDGRQYRHRQARSMLGAAQEQWLGERLAAGGAAWTLLGQGTLFGARDFQSGPGRMFWNDGWDGYPAARARLVGALQQSRASNPVLFGGDVHENWVGHVKADYERPESANVGVEFCGTSITSRPFQPERLRERMADNPHFVHADAQRRGYGVADFTRDRLQVRLRTLEDVTRADTAVRTEASFFVEAGRPLVERA